MPTAAVRISDPLPPLRPVSRRAVACMAAPERSRADSTARVWLPMSLGREAYHSAKPAATASNPAARAQVGAGGGDPGDGDGHRRVVGPLPGFEAEGPPPIMSIASSAAG